MPKFSPTVNRGHLDVRPSRVRYYLTSQSKVQYPPLKYSVSVPHRPGDPQTRPSLGSSPGGEPPGETEGSPTSAHLCPTRGPTNLPRVTTLSVEQEDQRRSILHIFPATVSLDEPMESLVRVRPLPLQRRPDEGAPCIAPKE